MEAAIRKKLMECPDFVLSIDSIKHQKRKYKLEFPELVGYFSIDGERQYQKGLSKLKYMTQPTGIDVASTLSGGNFDSWIHDKNIARFPLYEYLLDHTKLLQERSTLMDIYRLADPDMVKKERIFVTRLCRGNIYIRSVRHPHQLPKEISQQGHRYEQLMLSGNILFRLYCYLHNQKTSHICPEINMLYW